ncbi:MAG TPA: tryptophan--tRNA ligase [Anaerolineaceae bacterium]|nr:tryptophan--tRNA ligase [Anaerolineaceae bacterium]
MKEKGRILTGHRPTGPRHIGHLIGTLRNWVRLQEEYECFFLIADLHVLTTDYAHADWIRSSTLEVLADWLACGIDPQKSTLILQSALPQHTQLAVLLANLVTVSRLERIPTYKEQIKNLGLQPSLGLLSYPVLQAADILLYKANAVPVGEDQLPHIELTREIARRFNQTFQPTFPEPEALLSENPRLPGIDNRTMHTSYGNAIFLGDTPEDTTEKVMSMYTDPTRLRATDPGHVEGNPVFAYMDAFNPDLAELEDLKARYRVGKIGDVTMKHRLADVVNAALAPIRARRAELIRRPEELEEILLAGTQRARTVAQATLEEVQVRMGLGLGSGPISKGRKPAESSVPLMGTFC